MTYKKCPFCGGDPIDYFIVDEQGRNLTYCVACAECGAEIDNCSTEQEAKDAWNKRVEN